MSAPEPEPRREDPDDEAAWAALDAGSPVAPRSWWPGRAVVGPALAIGMTLLILATPIILLFIVVLSAWTIHRFQ